jgi:hypothetical protein
MNKTFQAAILAAAVTSTSTYALAQPISIPERLMGDLQTDLELADFQAAGIVGNLARETGNFQFMREMNPLVSGSRGGIGYSQWTGPRHDAFLAFVGEGDPLVYEANYGFLLEELEGPYARVLERLYETETLEEATKVFMRGYLAPHPKYRHLDERVGYAEAYLVGDFSGSGCASTHTLNVSGTIEVISECQDAIGSIRPLARPEWMLAMSVKQQDKPVSVALDFCNIEVSDPFTSAVSFTVEPS